VSDQLVLCYHAVSPTWDAELSVTPEALERQIAFFTRRGWHATTFTAGVLNPDPGRTLAITFDDAFASVKHYALPILSELGVPATVFAPTAFLDGEPELRWAGVDHWGSSPHAAELAPMRWADLRELAEAGWEIGSHTRTHPHLTLLDDESLERELSESRDQCARRLGRACDSIAYPYGDVDDRVAAASRRAGYRAGAALSSSLERLGPLRHPRVGIYRADDWRRFRLKASRPMRGLRASRLWRLRPS
jgi:peptidoglycan/xylan/chitin deacetylase (PgdA/CDA1 family)